MILLLQADSDFPYTKVAVTLFVYLFIFLHTALSHKWNIKAFLSTEQLGILFSIIMIKLHPT
jgi:hypothetical protein